MTFRDAFRLELSSLRMAFVLLSAIVSSRPAFSHDTWVETNTPLIRVYNAIYVDLCLGNHGNNHRDFKLASKIDLKGCTLDVISPKGAKVNLLPGVMDMGISAKEGYWKSKFVAEDSGLFVVSHTCDKVVNHGRPLRSIKGAKAYFAASETLDHPIHAAGPPSPIGHALEIVPLENPVAAEAGRKLGVQVLFRGTPLAGTSVVFIPRGETLSEGIDERFEPKTDNEGKAYFTPAASNQILLVTRRTEEGEKGEGYMATTYTATLTMPVSEPHSSSSN